MQRVLPICDAPIHPHTNIWEDHDDVKTGHNFIKPQIPIFSIRLYCQGKYLLGYWAKQLLYFIKYSFPFNFDRQVTLEHEIKNHKSANDSPKHKC